MAFAWDSNPRLVKKRALARSKNHFSTCFNRFGFVSRRFQPMAIPKPRIAEQINEWVNQTFPVYLL